MDIKNLRTLMLALVLMVVPVASAQDADIDESLPPVDEGTGEQLHVPVLCDPIDAICIGPVNHPLPVVVGVEVDDVRVQVWLNDGESVPFGPEYHNVTVPVVGLVVPVTVCPNTCDLPVPPDALLSGSVSLHITVNGVACSIEADGSGPQQLCEAFLEDGDGDEVPNILDACPEEAGPPEQGGCGKGPYEIVRDLVNGEMCSETGLAFCIEDGQTRPRFKLRWNGQTISYI